MPVIAVLGAQWGDEGKGKIVDLLAAQAQAVVRFAGGANAGHTIVNQYGKFGLRLLPSGIFQRGVPCVIGNGVVIDPEIVQQEMRMLEDRGVDVSGLVISDRAHLVLPYHRLLDRLEEEARGDQAIGTTRNGIGPAYADKAARVGIRVGDLLEPDHLRARLGAVLAQKNKLLAQVYQHPPLAFDPLYRQLLAVGHWMRPLVRDTAELLDDLLAQNRTVLLEGAQATLLDLDYGTYPYVTSSSPTAAGACQGSGLAPSSLSIVIGVYKAYTTRVGGGPMPTELLDTTGDRLRERGREFGTVTGRPRRCGWFDGAAARLSQRINGFNRLAITRLDILDEEPVLRLCAHYRIGSRILRTPPASLATFAACQPVYEELPGWQTPTTGCRRFADLPPAAQNYVKRIGDLIGVPVALVSVGPDRGETILMARDIGSLLDPTWPLTPAST